MQSDLYTHVKTSPNGRVPMFSQSGIKFNLKNRTSLKSSLKPWKFGDKFRDNFDYYQIFLTKCCAGYGESVFKGVGISKNKIITLHQRLINTTAVIMQKGHAIYYKRNFDFLLDRHSSL